MPWLHVALCLLLICCGCATQTSGKTRSSQQEAREIYLGTAMPSAGNILVFGFVRQPGEFAFQPAMTVSDALHAAGGYGTCKACEGGLKEWGTHPTYDMPPRVYRDSKTMVLPKDRPSWLLFQLELQDRVEFRHILF